MRRRSVSNFVSPGPRVPIPPPSRDRSRPDADQIRLPIPQLRQLDLQLAFPRTGMARKDVEDQHRAVDDRDGDEPFQIASLARPHRIQHEQQLRSGCGDAIRNVMRLTASNDKSWIEPSATLDDFFYDGGAGRLDQGRKFRELRGERISRLRKLHPQHDGFRARRQ